jgi:hypothetical protein
MMLAVSKLQVGIRFCSGAGDKTFVAAVTTE